MNTNYSISNFYELTPETRQSVLRDLAGYLSTFCARFKIGMSNRCGYFDKPMAQETVAIFNIHDIGYFAQSIGTTVPALLSDYELISNGYAEYFIFNEYENTLTLCTEDYLTREYFTIPMLEGMIQSAIDKDIQTEADAVFIDSLSSDLLIYFADDIADMVKEYILNEV